MPSLMEAQDLVALQRRRKMADALMQSGMNSSPTGHPLEAVARIVQALLGQKMAGEADQGMKDYDTGMQQDRTRALGEYMTKMQGSPGVAPLTPNDDEGNTMPSAPPVAPDRQAALGALLSARDPSLQQAGMAGMLHQPKADEPYTLKPGETRFGLGNKPLASLPETPKKEGPEIGKMRRVIRGGAEVDEEYTKDGWKKVGEGPRWQAPQGDGAPKGQYDAARGVMVYPDATSKPVTGASGAPLGAAPQKPTEAYLKQQTGVENVRNAIGEYREALKGYSPAQLVQPEARARMGTIYNNMLLQAKEAYNLGVLNGPDYSILQAVVTDPMSLKGAFSRGSLDDQAKKLDALMKKIGQTSASVHGQPAPGAPPAAGAGGFKYLGSE